MLLNTNNLIGGLGARQVSTIHNSGYSSNNTLTLAKAPSPQHAPYPSKNAGSGLIPTVKVDVPILAVFLALFILGAVAHMAIFQVNRKRGHKFIMSGMIFGFCMARITTCVMRIVWATRPTNISIAIAAQTFVAAGVVLLFVINLIFAQRIIRALHPSTGWHPSFSGFFTALYTLIVINLIMLITANVQSFYTLNKNTLRIDRDIQLYGQTYNALMAFLPIVLVIGGLVIPRKTPVEKFGNGRFRSKIYIVLLSSVTLTLGAAFRLGINSKTPRPRNNPAWYHSKACFYVFNFTLEYLVVVLYAVARVDVRFHVPDGSKGPGHYSNHILREGETSDQAGKLSARILDEDEIFENQHWDLEKK